jgi:hypothetical protein
MPQLRQVMKAAAAEPLATHSCKICTANGRVPGPSGIGGNVDQEGAGLGLGGNKVDGLDLSVRARVGPGGLEKAQGDAGRPGELPYGRGRRGVGGAGIIESDQDIFTVDDRDIVVVRIGVVNHVRAQLHAVVRREFRGVEEVESAAVLANGESAAVLSGMEVQGPELGAVELHGGANIEAGPGQ